MVWVLSFTLSENFSLILARPPACGDRKAVACFTDYSQSGTIGNRICAQRIPAMLVARTSFQRDDANLLGAVRRQLLDRGKQVADVGLRNIPGNEDNATVAILVRPGLQLDRRVGEMLDILHHHWTAAAGHIENALDPQKLRPAQRDQRLHGAGESGPCERLLPFEREAGNIVAVLGFGDKARA